MTNHQAIEAALDAAARSRRPMELPDCDVDQANPVHDDDDGEGLDAGSVDDPADYFTPDEAEAFHSAPPPWFLALLDRCMLCDTRSAWLAGGLCLDCQDASASMSHPGGILVIAS